MKKILISGACSYIGISLERFLSQWPEQYQVDTLDVIGDSWKSADIAGYDAVFHVAGIAHQKETAENSHLYFEVNRDLAVAMARKAKNAGIPHFVFMSTMSVYGMESGVITPDTKPQPKNSYGQSKLEAEDAMHAMEDESFRVAVLRPPMVYGKNCRGNFQR
jgi:UDP-glucose 4-epimerase